MIISAIAATYWRKVKSGERTYESIPAAKAGEVLELAETEVAHGVITEEDFVHFIGKAYVAQSV